jgi:hypothetical protein
MKYYKYELHWTGDIAIVSLYWLLCPEAAMAVLHKAKPRTALYRKINDGMGKTLRLLLARGPIEFMMAVNWHHARGTLASICSESLAAELAKHKDQMWIRAKTEDRRLHRSLLSQLSPPVWTHSAQQSN